MDREYWEMYYSKQAPNERPSDFAQFCAEKYDTSFGKLFDIGCGDGRDTLFFTTKSIPCIGVDQSLIAIEENAKRGLSLGLESVFIHADFSSCNYDLLSSGPYSIYSRFTLHAISYEEEER